MHVHRDTCFVFGGGGGYAYLIQSFFARKTTGGTNKTPAGPRAVPASADWKPPTPPRRPSLGTLHALRDSIYASPFCAAFTNSPAFDLFLFSFPDLLFFFFSEQRWTT